MEKGRGKGTDTLQTDEVFTRKEYIEREAAKRAIMSQYLNRANKTKYADVIDTVPAANVVPVVRCGECANKFDWPWCGMFSDDGYCSAGVRKDGNGDA